MDGGESAMNLNRPGLQRLFTLVDSGKVKALIVAKLDRLTRSVKDLCGLLELFEKRIVAGSSSPQDRFLGRKRPSLALSSATGVWGRWPCCETGPFRSSLRTRFAVRGLERPFCCTASAATPSASRRHLPTRGRVPLGGGVESRRA